MQSSASIIGVLALALALSSPAHARVWGKNKPKLPHQTSFVGIGPTDTFSKCSDLAHGRPPTYEQYAFCFAEMLDGESKRRVSSDSSGLEDQKKRCGHITKAHLSLSENDDFADTRFRLTTDVLTTYCDNIHEIKEAPDAEDAPTAKVMKTKEFKKLHKPARDMFKGLLFPIIEFNTLARNPGVFPNFLDEGHFSELFHLAAIALDLSRVTPIYKGEVAEIRTHIKGKNIRTVDGARALTVLKAIRQALLHYLTDDPGRREYYVPREQPLQKQEGIEHPIVEKSLINARRNVFQRVGKTARSFIFSVKLAKEYTSTSAGKPKIISPRAFCSPLGVKLPKGHTLSEVVYQFYKDEKLRKGSLARAMCLQKAVLSEEKKRSKKDDSPTEKKSIWSKFTRKQQPLTSTSRQGSFEESTRKSVPPPRRNSSVKKSGSSASLKNTEEQQQQVISPVSGTSGDNSA